MAQLGEQMLRRGPAGDSVRRGYLLGAAVLGRLARGEGDAALSLWSEFAPRVGGAASGPLFQLLRGHVAAELRKRQLQPPRGK